MILMANIKKQAIEAIERLPDDITYEDIMETIYVQQKIAIGLQQAAEGKLTSHAEFINEIREQQADRPPKRD